MKISQGHWTLLGPGSEEKWYGSSSFAQKGEWDSAANKMVQRFRETGLLVFKSISALSRGSLKQKKGKNTVHFNGDSTNTELLFQTIHSVNQLSIYGAVANWCHQFGLTEKKKGRVATPADEKILTMVQPEEWNCRCLFRPRRLETGRILVNRKSTQMHSPITKRILKKSNE